MKVKFCSALLLTVFLLLVAEDVVHAHSVAADNISTTFEHFFKFHADHNNSPNHPLENTSDFDVNHFGHCSFLLISTPLISLALPSSELQFPPYRFFLHFGFQQNLLRPPIFS